MIEILVFAPGHTKNKRNRFQKTYLYSTVFVLLPAGLYLKPKLAREKTEHPTPKLKNIMHPNDKNKIQPRSKHKISPCEF